MWDLKNKIAARFYKTRLRRSVLKKMAASSVIRFYPKKLVPEFCKCKGKQRLEERMQKISASNLESATCNLQADCGFTLLEIMVSISIIALVLVSVYRLHAQTISMHQSARFYTTAPLLAQNKMAEFEIKPLDELTDDSGSFADEFPGYSWKVAINDVESETLGSTAEDLKKIDIIVSFNQDEFTYDLRTYRFFTE
jgi:general secretion pathway protein I